MDFNKERFIHFAQYDLVINKTFYRNFALFTSISLIGGTVLAFMGRYLLWTYSGVNASSYYAPSPTDIIHYQNMELAAQYIFTFLTIMMSIFAGCWAHNLRNKQGRINELTLPATNLEKFVWHVGLMVIGGFTLCLLSLLLADGINALLTLLIYDSENGIPSLTAAVFNVADLSFISDRLNLTIQADFKGHINTNLEEYESAISIIRAAGVLMFTSFISNIAVYMFGNALKYKYNIILTYVILQAISAIVGIIGFILFAIQLITPNPSIQEIDPQTILPYVPAALYIWSTANILLSVFFIWKSFQLYKKAQITTSFNK